jgi:6-phosphogluconolactonase
LNASPKINILSTREDLSVAAAGHVALLAAQATKKRHGFTVALSGGSLMEILAPQLSESPLRNKVDWSAWHVFWADERCVPWSSPESNYGAAYRMLFKHVDVPPGQIHAIDDTLGAVEAAEAYESILRKAFQPETGSFPRIDLILLGIGEDGHIASLFPGSPLLRETRRWVAPVLDAPKPPPVRVTLTLPVINSARHVVFVAAGPGKRAILSQVIRPGLHRPRLPAELVNPSDGELQWFVDAAAAGNLRKR